ncbi:hypothetical protein [Polaribacter glomeratus]|uniref:Uncharacterized protein n=1 Tax=Polaribacter glomeratus TaxID=102 RepID=A0A2S7WXW9_9FLAO|nr:hypothetical protein [Polaribacter glomeratus]PQJ82182.1 hypothetical protein BTO16_06155 [Polaribacter glomeratus]TXD66776.1 hypothetical protein ESX12_04465 [Polaribacter glomeratus]
MKFSKKEKQFWQTHYHFDKPSQLHGDWQQIWSMHGVEKDDFFYFFTLRVTSIIEVHLKETLITDKAVEYMTKFKKLQNLYLRRHENITKASIPFINKMNNLESLNITKTKITLTDLSEQLNNQSLKEVFLDSEENEENILENAFILKERMPNCAIYLNTSDPTGEKPIFN